MRLALLTDDFRSDTFAGEDFQQEGVWDSSVDEVDFADASIKRIDGGADLGDHAAFDGAVFDEVQGFRAGQRIDEAGRVAGITQDTGNIGNVDELDGLEFLGKGCCCKVCINVEWFVRAEFTCKRGDYGGDFHVEGFRDARQEGADDAAYFADVNGVAVFIFLLEAFSNEDFRARDADGFASEFSHGLDESGVDDAGERAFDDGDGFRRGDAEAVDEAGFESGVSHGLRDGLAAAVDDDWVDAKNFEQDDVFEELADEFRVVHGATAKLDQEDFVAIGLQVRQGIDDDGCFVNEGVDGVGHDCGMK